MNIFRLHGYYFSAWGSPVGSFLNSETYQPSRSTTGDEATKGRTAEHGRSPQNRQRRSATVNAHPNGACAHYVMVSKFQWKPFWLATQRDLQNDWTATQNRVNYDVFAQAPLARLLWQKGPGIFFYTNTFRTFCCRPLCIAPGLLQSKVIGDSPFRAAGWIGTCTTHTCSKHLLVGKKAKPLIFAREKDRCFPEVKPALNWNVRRSKASLRPWKKENWIIFHKSGVFCTNNAQAPSLFSNITLTSRRSYVETVSGNSALLPSNGISRHVYQPPVGPQNLTLSFTTYEKNQIHVGISFLLEWTIGHKKLHNLISSNSRTVNTLYGNLHAFEKPRNSVFKENQVCCSQMMKSCHNRENRAQSKSVIQDWFKFLRLQKCRRQALGNSMMKVLLKLFFLMWQLF